MAINLANFGAVRWTAYLRPPVTREGRRERNIVVVVLQVKARGEADSGARSTTVQTRFTMPRERLRAGPGGTGVTRDLAVIRVPTIAHLLGLDKMFNLRYQIKTRGLASLRLTQTVLQSLKVGLVL